MASGINIKWLLVFGTGAKRIIMANKTNRGHFGLKKWQHLKRCRHLDVDWNVGHRFPRAVGPRLAPAGSPLDALF
jgi:hypothetical protein